MNFQGFTVPDGAWIPPELIYLLPHIGEAKLKVLIAVIYHNSQIGGSEPLSLRDIERITGLARQSVITAIKEMLEPDQQFIERQPVGQSYVYLPRARIGSPASGLNIRPPLAGETSPNFGLVQNLD